MKNKLLVSVFLAALAAFAFTACKSKSDVKDVCTDLLKETLHKSARNLYQLNGESLTISEYEFPSTNVNDNRLVYRTISFGNGTNSAKVVDNMTYEYGEWSEDATKFSLIVTPSNGAPYTLWFRSNAFYAPDGRVFGGEGARNVARVEKWEKIINSLNNTDWEAKFQDEFVLDTIYKDSVRQIPVPPMGVRYDTIKVPTGEFDTLSADTTCTFKYLFNRDATTFANTGHFKSVSVRTKYDREKAKTDTIGTPVVSEFDFEWFFSDVASDSKFTIVVRNTTAEEANKILNISKYQFNAEGKATSFSLDDDTYQRPVKP